MERSGVGLVVRLRGGEVRAVQNPMEGHVTSEFGTRRPRGRHKGIDIAPGNRVPGRAVFAAFAGSVVKIATDQVPGDMTSGRAPGRTGNGAVVQNPDGERQVYNHVMPVVRVGDSVSEGQLIGHLDRSGQQSGPHLHFEVWSAAGVPRNPRVDFQAKRVTPGQGGPPPVPGRTFLPLGTDGDFGHRTITELERALARIHLYRGAIEDDRGKPAVAGPVLFKAYQRFLAQRRFDVGPVDGGFGRRSVRAEQTWLHRCGHYPFAPDGDRGAETIKALQRALNARGVG